MSKQAIELLKECRDSLAECSLDPFDGYRSDADSQTLSEYDEAIEAVQKLVSERDELASRVRELEANARRYEWLRENNAYSIHDRLFADCPMHKFNDAMLDAAIDAAIHATKGGKL